MFEQKKPFERDPNELGVLWKKDGPRGTYLSGTLEVHGEKVPVVVFTNTNKKSEKAPDYRILRADRSARREAPAPVPAAYPTGGSDDIPW